MFNIWSGDAKYNVLAGMNRNGTVDMLDFYSLSLRLVVRVAVHRL